MPKKGDYIPVGLPEPSPPSSPSASFSSSSTKCPSTCLKCKARRIEYEAMPCGHGCLCKGCAMKMATGGKCKVCGDMFTELRRVRKHS
ncbi:hypothetical protein TrCOL_g8814 [Triparma columacea]|uniref:RING-type domain-containing protein n=1 Tax=Triparma columacea TaxID=722753 RepID=A0A9W7G6J0_9STRA|nr:hypothetical protein TrCOL_g8814 [Triparma columacea]